MNKTQSILQKVTKLLQQNQWQQALSLLTQHCKTDPQNPQIPESIGLFFQSNNMPRKAERFYIESLNINSDQATIFYNLGVIYQATNEHAKAIKSYNKAIDIDGSYAKAHANLAYIYNETGNNKKSAQHCQLAIQKAPDNAQIQHMLASLGSISTPDIANKKYISDVFDGYANHYDKHMLETLEFKTPQLIFKTATQHLKNNQTNRILDLGCGTGLCGELFIQKNCELSGVDLSKKMIDIAKTKNCYNNLYVDDVAHHLTKYINTFDMIISSDVFIYIGKLDMIFETIPKALKTKGLFIFSVESLVNSNENFHLNTTGRYSHSEHYIKQLVKKNNMQITRQESVKLRKQNNLNVDGYIYVVTS